ncbi:MAG TPA: 1,2-phenylacetyl-CoA epoxidase subunit PaaC [Flavisolibacter sp.]|nr:1,2-phenylacetyl-CoA epoxidase subunit PaaC [Flavisolibacter sp.]
MSDSIKVFSNLSSPLGGQGAFLYILHLADNVLILGQRNSEWTGHGPVLEQDIAITNISLDYLGQARNFYQYAAELYNGFSDDEKQSVDKWLPRLWKDYNRGLEEDDLAFLRDEHQYLNLLLVEVPKGDWAKTVFRQFLFSCFQYYLFQNLQKKSSDQQIAAIADKSLKEISYHLKWSSEWVIRLGDGTDESHRRMNDAVTDLWKYTGELFQPALYEESVFQAFGVAIQEIQESWNKKVDDVFAEALLKVPEQTGNLTGGKAGRHTEHMGYLLAEMQYLQRAYPNSKW